MRYLLIVFVAVACGSCRERTPYAAECRANLRTLSVALYQYADNNGFAFPTDEVYRSRSFLPQKSDVYTVCPVTKKRYIYYSGHSDSGVAILARDSEPHHGVVFVLFTFEVMDFPEGSWQEDAEAHLKEFSEGLKK